MKPHRRLMKIDEGASVMRGMAASTSKRILDKSEFKDGKLDSPSPLAQPPECPECTSQRVWRDGLRYTKNGDVQRWLCRDCGYRFSQTESKDPSQPLQKDSRWSINTASAYSLPRQVCELLTEDSKNLAEVTSRTEKRAAGATKNVEAEVKGKIIEYIWWLKKQGYRDRTIEDYGNVLKTLKNKGADICDPESVKETIARLSVSETTKHNYAVFYNKFVEFIGVSWTQPIYKQIEKIPFIPLESEIDQLIYGSGRLLGTTLQIAKETAMRLGEITRLQWQDVDTKKSLIIVNNPGKRGKPGIYKVSNELITRIMMLPKNSNRIFNTTPKNLIMNLIHARKRLARKVGNPRLLQIHFHTLRHWKATIEYHKTKDILHVKDNILRHRDIKATLIYIHLEKLLFTSETGEFHVKVTSKSEEIKQLLSVGFEYICQKDDLMYFRKRK